MKNILAILTIAIILTACKKSIDELPEATQTGANAFGLRLDGAFWVPQKFAGINTPILKVQLLGNDIRINAMNFASEPLETEFEIYLKNATATGVYQLNQNTDIYPSTAGSYAYYVKRRLNPLNEWITSSKYPGTVTLTKLDLANRIVSGTFEFTAGSIDSSASPITVTEGRFDLKLQ
jgi:hypothetical protein